jgi:hypothetical protein
MWERQVRFNRKFIKPEEVDKRIPHAKDMVLSMFTEQTELLEQIGDWRKFRFNKPQPSKAGILEEGVDIFKFLIDTMDTFGITPEEFVDYFKQKSYVVEQRYMWEQHLEAWQKDPTVKVVAVDLDGVLADYPVNWIGFVNKELGTAYTTADFSGTVPGGLPLAQSDYIVLKNKFRENGLEASSANPTEHAEGFLTFLRDRGYKIMILSARPYKEYKRTQADAILWMNRYHLPYDAFVWGSDKAFKIHRDAPGTVALIEDDPVTANYVAANGIRTYLIDTPYNHWLLEGPGSIRVGSLKDLMCDDLFPEVKGHAIGPRSV